jgi:hypothetical protein
MIISVILIIALIYLLIGVLFVPFFYAKGIRHIDETVKGSSIGFYIIISPGVIVFWPVLLRKWRKALKEQAYE